MYYAVKSLSSARFPFNLSVPILEKLAKPLFLKKINHYMLTAKIADSGDALLIIPERKFPKFTFTINDKEYDAKF